MAFGCLESHNLSVPVVPVGLTYFERDRFRSRVVVEYGPPIVISKPLVELHKSDPRAACNAFLGRVADGMRGVLVTTDGYDTLALVHTARRLVRRRRCRARARVRSVGSAGSALLDSLRYASSEAKRSEAKRTTCGGPRGRRPSRQRVIARARPRGGSSLSRALSRSSSATTRRRRLHRSRTSTAASRRATSSCSRATAARCRPSSRRRASGSSTTATRCRHAAWRMRRRTIDRLIGRSVGSSSLGQREGSIGRSIGSSSLERRERAIDRLIGRSIGSRSSGVKERGRGDHEPSSARRRGEGRRRRRRRRRRTHGRCSRRRRRRRDDDDDDGDDDDGDDGDDDGDDGDDGDDDDGRRSGCATTWCRRSRSSR